MKTAFVALHGGMQTSEGTPKWDYLNFPQMSGLLDLEDADCEVYFPLARRFRTWGLYFHRATAEIERLKKLVSDIRSSGYDRVIGLGFSEGATALMHYLRYIQFDGIVAVSGIIEPFDNWRWGERHYCPAIFWAGENERQKNRTAAETWYDEFVSQGCLTEKDFYTGGDGMKENHRWPAEWNHRIKPFFGVE